MTMSLAADPKSTYSHVLFSDRQLPEEKQPVFYFRYLTSRQYRNFDVHRKEFSTAENSEDVISAALKVLEMVLVGWKNVKNENGEDIEFDIAKTEDIGSLVEIVELASMAISQEPTPEDKKKLDLPSQSSLDSSAKNVQVT
jgi:hypothetical protein